MNQPMNNDSNNSKDSTSELIASLTGLSSAKAASLCVQAGYYFANAELLSAVEPFRFDRIAVALDQQSKVQCAFVR